ncbi:hypothetical protein BU23DRAFT_503340 [Bimuria novae-zelandiae CBS 107.79]|uniref:GRF-like zinc ribbon domain-containing protein n=1 Tax=Bimuria novae-zelandiae CBS 107.79 TaxID=1447943 RepID=A0A6A5VKC0_9PLEO|nr:hypothetical protein BU23DRAFT_503340 [Bimuria novae-zelandiae CBS 107.79]
MTDTMRVESLGPGHPTYSDVPVSEIMRALSRPLQPQLPLSQPRCRHCNLTTSLRRRTTGPLNRNGNVGRPYYICIPCEDNDTRGWVTWDDERGICDGNPVCHCGGLSRQDRKGNASRRTGLGFWTCATGSCNYYSEYSNGWTTQEMNTLPHAPQCTEFYPWLL